jgi:hypothetical protein
MHMNAFQRLLISLSLNDTCLASSPGSSPAGIHSSHVHQDQERPANLHHQHRLYVLDLPSFPLFFAHPVVQLQPPFANFQFLTEYQQMDIKHPPRFDLLVWPAYTLLDSSCYFPMPSPIFPPSSLLGCWDLGCEVRVPTRSGKWRRERLKCHPLCFQRLGQCGASKLQHQRSVLIAPSSSTELRHRV